MNFRPSSCEGGKPPRPVPLPHACATVVTLDGVEGKGHQAGSCLCSTCGLLCCPVPSLEEGQRQVRWVLGGGGSQLTRPQGGGSGPHGPLCGSAGPGGKPSAPARSYSSLESWQDLKNSRGMSLPPSSHESGPAAARPATRSPVHALPAPTRGLRAYRLLPPSLPGGPWALVWSVVFRKDVRNLAGGPGSPSAPPLHTPSFPHITSAGSSGGLSPGTGTFRT